MLKIYDQYHAPIGYIYKYKDLTKESELSTAEKTLSFTYLSRNHKIDYEYYIQDKTEEYVVKEIRESTDGYPQITAVLNTEELEGKTWEVFLAKDATPTEAANLALAGTGWSVDTCRITKRRSMGLKNVSSKIILQKICVVFMCEMILDSKNKTVSFYDQVGSDRGVYFIRGLNLKKISISGDTDDYYTRIIPIGRDGLKITEVNSGKDYLDNHQYSSKTLTYIWEDTSYEDATALKEDAEKKLEEMSKPKKSYSVDIRDLAKMKPGFTIFSYGLGDTVTLLDRWAGIRDKQRIVKLVEYPGNPGQNRAEIANVRPTFDELQNKIREAASIIEAATNLDGSINGAAVDKVTIDQILHFNENLEEGIKNSSTLSTINSDILNISKEVNIVKGSIGTLEATVLKATDAELKYATIESLDVQAGKVHDLEVDYGNFKTVTADEFAAKTALIDKVSGDLADYKTVIAGEMIAAKGWMAEGSIGDAQISKVSANKLGVGTIDTALVTVAGTDGKLRISDNTIQISDENRVRVQMGKDAAGDYTLAVWDSTGKLIWDALGATENTIQRKIIRDKMVADDAAIQALKIDFQSFDTVLTNQGVTISGTVVQVGSKTLNVALSEQTQSIAQHGEILTDHAAKITANENAIALRVTSQAFESYKNAADSEIASAKTRLSTSESNITALQGQISLKVEQTDIDSAINGIEIGGRNLILKSATKKLNPYAGATISFETVSVNEWGATDAIRAHGVSGTSVIMATLATGRSDFALDGKNYTHSIYIKNQGASVVRLISNGTYHPLGLNAINVAPGETRRVILHGSGTGAHYLQFNFITLTAGEAFDFVYWHPKIETGTKVTDWTPAPEDVEASINAVDNKFANYSTTTQMQSAIDLSKSSIMSSVSETYSKKSELTTLSDKVTSLETWKSEASQKITKDGIIATVGSYYAKDTDLTNVKNRVTTAESTITQHADQIALKIEKDNVISAINQSAEEIKISAGKITLAGTTIADAFTATNLTITGNSTLAGWQVTADRLQKETTDCLVYLAPSIGNNKDVLVFKDKANNSWPLVFRGTGEAIMEKATISGGKIGGFTISGSDLTVTKTLAGSGNHTAKFTLSATGNYGNMIEIYNNSLKETVFSADYLGGVKVKDLNFGTIAGGSGVFTSGMSVTGASTFNGHISLGAGMGIRSYCTATSWQGGAQGDKSIINQYTCNGWNPWLYVRGKDGAWNQGVYLNDGYYWITYTSDTTMASQNSVTYSWTFQPDGIFASTKLKCPDIKGGDANGQTGFRFRSGSNWAANSAQADNTTALGESSLRWTRVYAANATISTSDENEKNILSGITEPYEALFMDLRPILYMWKQFGNATHIHDRIHCGLGAQSVLASARKYGLSEKTVAAICRDDLDEPTIDGRTERYGLAYEELHGLEIHMIQKNAMNIQNMKTGLSILENKLQEALCRITVQENTINDLRAQLQAQA